MAEKFTELFHCIWRKAAVPQEVNDASIIHLYKRKGNVQVFDNYRNIFLLSIAGMILAKIRLNRLNGQLDLAGLLTGSQFEFRKDSGRHNIYSKLTPREIPGTKCGPLHDLCRPHQNMRYSQS